MANDQVKIARIQATDRQLQAVVDLLKHPIYAALITFVIVEWLQSKKLMGTIAGTTLETAVVLEPVLSNLAKSGALEQMFRSGSQAAGDLTKTLGTLAPPLLK